MSLIQEVLPNSGQVLHLLKWNISSDHFPLFGGRESLIRPLDCDVYYTRINGEINKRYPKVIPLNNNWSKKGPDLYENVGTHNMGPDRMLHMTIRLHGKNVDNLADWYLLYCEHVSVQRL